MHQNDNTQEHRWPFNGSGWDQPTEHLIRPSIPTPIIPGPAHHETWVDQSVWNHAAEIPETEKPIQASHSALDTFLRRALMAGLVVLVWFVVGVIAMVAWSAITHQPAPYEGDLLGGL